MIDGFLNSLRNVGERVQRRGEEVTQAARLRLDIFQLGREQGEMYARLGRAYHGNASVGTLEEIRAEISRVDEEIAAREKLIAELGADLPGDDIPGDAAGGDGAGGQHSVSLSKSPSGPASSSPLYPTATHPNATPAEAPTALSVWREKEATRMTDQDLKTDTLTTEPLITGPATDATGRPDGENADPTTTAGGSPHSTPFTSHVGGQAQATNPNEAGDPEKLKPTSNTASMGNEAAREEMVRHESMLKEGKLATQSPDPLANKD